MKGNISPSIMIQLDSMFQKKGWKIDESIEVKRSLYGRYCEILKSVDENEQNLLIELSYQFLQVEMKDFPELFFMSFILIDESILESKRNIIFTPLTTPYVKVKKGRKKVERPKVKSAQCLFYLLDAYEYRWIDYSPKFVFVDSINGLINQYKEDETLVVFIDDYIGTGETAVVCIKQFVEEMELKTTVNFNDFCVVTIAAQADGITHIFNELKIKSYSDIIRTKGISDKYPTDLAENHVNTMISIEKKLKCPDEYSLGFGKSEALITFANKTPNNTFPVYWHETERKIAPFPRYKIFKL